MVCFQNQNILLPVPSKVKVEPMEIDTEAQEGSQQKQTCYMLVKKFSKEVGFEVYLPYMNKKDNYLL